ncbi:Glycosyltransferase, catalytic subunit of cellulose synthase and poly-beta-1,6-N-acetylglucosamine synthase [Arenibacter nanhaiticus]|uniref:Glycosyltransferase, catalytic subunit of cellulose synthase and poly-beta-1,6-N-acetylglucosamine synthase n=1 Tax=Arenibacter nanhaiticus TaxID=558155 RepID=A0A1M6K2W8_9FLAO|nr:glycosyltransferase [Arenibacter nanhaiticus]SHJ53339.1 Glycosyltransferase, catalytic subunit of cellulose synthase and poly-beta-1,6-N-acetylglucosamine synthase [Arenibacter nanhaiticus]
MDLFFSFIVPVYNRPIEIKELLQSLSLQTYGKPFEVVVVEDGSEDSSQEVVAAFKDNLSITYLTKKNSGPGDSRNYGMKRAKGNYFIVLDSDCILPPHYLGAVAESLNKKYVPCFGGPDAAHESFTVVQKAINYAMTSLLTTGGIRGAKAAVGKFQPRSFNMGISKIAFEKTKGYGNIHPGEDPDLTFRIWKEGFETKLIPEAFVYHKRRIDWNKFYKQVSKFGKVRPILNRWHPGTAKITYWFPTLFCVGFIAAMVLAILGSYWLISLFALYFIALFVHSLVLHKNIVIAFLSLIAASIQFMGYGSGFLKNTVLMALSKKEPQELFPKLFFKPNLQRDK